LTKLARSKEQHEGAMSERLGGIENVERALYRASSSQITDLEARVSFLGTVGATAPFVGLFGTVMGILSAFNEIAEKGNATLTTVAAPIGNALFATAAGLFAAIPAVVAYNSFVSRIRVFDTEMGNFSSDFLNIVKRHFFK
jgi:biopolymer transport protein TolQ